MGILTLLRTQAPFGFPAVVRILAQMTQHNKPRRKNRRPDELAGSAAKPKKPPKKQPVKLRIIGGDMRGRTVVYHGADFTRPMKDSVRESLFNIIGPRIRGTHVIDPFAGTGAVTFEAISRGASRAVMVERNRNAHRFLVSTAETLGIAGRIKILMGDGFRIGARLLEPMPSDAELDDTPRILFLCPPYAMWRSESDGRALAGLIHAGIQNSPPGSLIVAETDKHDPESVLPEAQWDHRVYGGTRLSIVESELVCGLRM